MVLPYDNNWETKESFYDTLVWYPLVNHKCQPCLQIFFGVFEPHFHVILKWLLSYLRESGLLRHSFDEFGRVQKLASLDRRSRAAFHSLEQVDSVTLSNISPACFFKALRLLHFFVAGLLGGLTCRGFVNDSSLIFLTWSSRENQVKLLSRKLQNFSIPLLAFTLYDVK